MLLPVPLARSVRFCVPLQFFDDNMSTPIAPALFDDLVASRRAWIEQELKPWCQRAARIELIKAEQEWTDLAGRPDPARTLWPWAWGRFPMLTQDGLQGIDETYEVRVTLRDGRSGTGYPDNRASQRGQLVLVGTNGTWGPVGIDDVASVERL